MKDTKSLTKAEEHQISAEHFTASHLTNTNDQVMFYLGILKGKPTYLLIVIIILLQNCGLIDDRYIIEIGDISLSINSPNDGDTVPLDDSIEIVGRVASYYPVNFSKLHYVWSIPSAGIKQSVEPDSNGLLKFRCFGIPGGTHTVSLYAFNDEAEFVKRTIKVFALVNLYAYKRKIYFYKFQQEK